MIDEDSENHCSSNAETDAEPRYDLTIDTSETLDSRQLIHLTDVTELSLRCKQILHLNALSELPRLSRLHISSSKIDGSDVVFDNGFNSIETLSLHGTGVIDVVLSGIRDLENLKHLYLSSTSISDQGIRVIIGLCHLESLSIARTEVSDVAIETLLSLRNLRSLDVAGSKISDSGIRTLINSLHGLESLMRMGEVIGDGGESMGPCYFNALSFESDTGVLDRSNIAENLSKRASEP